MLKYLRVLEKYPSLCMASAACLALIIKIPFFVPAQVIPILLGILIYLSYFKLELKDINAATLKSAIVFSLVRFIILPVILWAFFAAFFPQLKAAALLFSLAPAGASCPAFTVMLGGSVGLAIAILVISSSFSVISIPLVFAWLEGKNIAVDQVKLFTTIASILFLPGIIFLLTKKINLVIAQVNKNSRLVSILSISLIIFLALHQQRAQILLADQKIFIYLLAAFFLYILFFIFGLLYSQRADLSQKYAFEASSGFNNNALVIGLATLYFPELALFCVLTEIPWSLGFWLCNRVNSLILQEK